MQSTKNSFFFDAKGTARGANPCRPAVWQKYFSAWYKVVRGKQKCCTSSRCTAQYFMNGKPDIIFFVIPKGRSPLEKGTSMGYNR